MIEDKIKSVEKLKTKLSLLKSEGKSIVFTNGCFDILHVGHISYLEEAKKQGDVLVVAINSDISVKKVKGAGRPILSEGDRLKMLAALESVDFVTIFSQDDPASIVTELDPDIIVKGSDWKEEEIIGAEHVKNSGGRVASIPFLKGYSTTELINKIKGLK
ncbi:MAG: D-glycero-beta-D-manno-heptose 1-phosphate adenylyltransferase [Candidatus Omnitrophota bacterium]